MERFPDKQINLVQDLFNDKTVNKKYKKVHKMYLPNIIELSLDFVERLTLSQSIIKEKANRPYTKQYVVSEQHSDDIPNFKY